MCILERPIAGVSRLFRLIGWLFRLDGTDQVPIAQEGTSPRDGRFIERVGFYDPKAPEGRENLRVDMERLAYWQGKGAKLSDTAARLVKQFGSKAS